MAKQEKVTFQKRTSSILLSLLIGLVIVSFMFSGLDSRTGSGPDTIAKVGSHPIKIKEYNSAYERMLDNASQWMTGGKPLTQKQIEQMGIKRNALETLINQKLIIILAEKLGITPGPEENRQTIRSSFGDSQANPFNVEQYKFILSRNGWTPLQYEEQIRSDLKAQKASELLNTVPLSQKFLEDIANFKKNIIKVNIATIQKESLKKHININPSEIIQHLSNEENVSQLRLTFENQKSQLDQPEQVKAKHILIRAENITDVDAKKRIEALAKKANPKNFHNLAKKNTEDPSGKENGGDLGWFSKNMMDPAFEQTAFATPKGTISKPVLSSFGWHLIYVEDKKSAYNATFDLHKQDLAKQAIRDLKKDELDQLSQKIQTEMKTLLEKNNLKAASSLAKKYDISFTENEFINKLDGFSNTLSLDNSHIQTLFDDTKENIHVIERGQSIYIVRRDFPTQKEKATVVVDLDQEKQKQHNLLRSELGQNIITSLKEKTRIKDFGLIR